MTGVSPPTGRGITEPGLRIGIFLKVDEAVSPDKYRERQPLFLPCVMEHWCTVQPCLHHGATEQSGARQKDEVHQWLHVKTGAPLLQNGVVQLNNCRSTTGFEPKWRNCFSKSSGAIQKWEAHQRLQRKSGVVFSESRGFTSKMVFKQKKLPLPILIRKRQLFDLHRCRKALQLGVCAIAKWLAG